MWGLLRDMILIKDILGSNTLVSLGFIDAWGLADEMTYLVFNIL